MLAFVTGATGFLGSHVARVLAEQGADLRLLVRASSDLRNVSDLNADLVTGDLRDSDSIAKAMAGCDVVFHVAADYRLWVRDPDAMYRSNVEGTRSLLEAARKLGVRRVVYTSSVATMGFGSTQAAAELRSAGQVRAPAPTQTTGATLGPAPTLASAELRSAWTGEGARPHTSARPYTSNLADEDSPVALADMIGHYKRSKFMAEQVAVDAAKSGVDVVIVNPTTPIGERDIKPTPTGRIVVDFLKRKFPAYVETGLNLVDATECARGHVQALEKGRSGERYILGGENLTLKQILDRLGAITGLPSPTVKLPYIFALAAGVVDEMVTGRLLGREPRATIDAVRMGRKMMFVSSAKAERELGWRMVPVDGALRRSVEWFRGHGYAESGSVSA
jgi:dihydroflavonol-4-reductase